MKKLVPMTTVVTFLMCVSPVMSFASVETLKVYREVNPDLKPNCLYCHVDKMPKKEDGKHELNAYGLKLKEALGSDKKELSAEELKQAYITVFKQLGRHDATDAGAATGK